MARYSTTHDISRLLDLPRGLARNPIIFNLCLLGQLSQNSARPVILISGGTQWSFVIAV